MSVIGNVAVPAESNAPAIPTSSVAQRATFEKWLLDLTGIPTAAGREDRVIEWILSWVKKRANRIAVVVDAAGNLLLHQGPVTQATGRTPTQRPLLITAHLDHPAFVVRGIVDSNHVECEFRGGVHDPYFEKAKIELIDRRDRTRLGTIVALESPAKPYKRVTVRVAGGSKGVDIGDVARWKLPAPRFVKSGRGPDVVRHLHTHACDDLAAAAAALAAFELLAGKPGFEHVGLLFTVAEEVGFVGAIATARAGSVPRDARLLCLENSRSFVDSPIGAGAILRVGDRLSVFSPELTNRLAALYVAYAAQRLAPPVLPKARPGQRPPKAPAAPIIPFLFQRKLMAGGACEATAFSAYGYESTCLCLPLGNYHNMEEIDAVLAGKRPAKIAPEYISVEDFHSLIEMLAVAAARLDVFTSAPLRDRMETLFAENKHVVAALNGR